jgi:nucleotide-binding universal stress UspA family protein
MSYAAILVHAQADAGALPRLRCARDLADRFDATLIGLAAEMVPPAPADDGYSNIASQWYVAMVDLAETNIRNARAAFDEVVKGASKKAVWEQGVVFPGAAMARASRAADLIVASRPLRHDDPYRHASPADLAIAAGRPVLVAPVGGEPLSARKIILAWKDTREARRAMADAMPFFRRAEEVTVLEVCGPEDRIDAETRTNDVAEALRRHGVTAVAKVSVHHPADGHEILRQASLNGADLVVAGAYGHSRLGEWMFGGVTHDLLNQHDLYVLLSH